VSCTSIAARRSDYVDRQTCPLPYEIKRTQFFQPSHLTPRIVAQRGWFSVHKWNDGTGRFSRFDHLKQYRDRLVRLDIPPDQFGSLRDDPDRMAINDATQFPDLDGLCRYLNWYNSLLEDEGETP
jgi:hypothetical protein